MAPAETGSKGLPDSVYPLPDSATLAGSTLPRRHSLMKWRCAWLLTASASLVASNSAHAWVSQHRRARHKPLLQQRQGLSELCQTSDPEDCGVGLTRYQANLPGCHAQPDLPVAAMLFKCLEEQALLLVTPRPACWPLFAGVTPPPPLRLPACILMLAMLWQDASLGLACRHALAAVA